MLNLLTSRLGRGHRWNSALWACLCALALLSLAPLSVSAATAQRSFASPQAGADALAQAVRANDSAALRAILGPYGSKLVSSGDPVADERNRASFVQAYDEANRVVLEDSRNAELLVGQQAWPLPIPLVQSVDGQWHFDTRKGETEILSRRIGANELAAIQVCLAIVDAQREFSARDSDGDGLKEFASRFTSTPGQRDGLYWPTSPDEPLSPLGPLLAAAAKDGYLSPNAGSQEPYQGYYYRILTRQGKDAPGGAYNYFVKGQMVAGFALLAYPARYGASGVMSFMVSQDGVVYQKNLGRKTSTLAAHVPSFNPDTSWQRAPQIAK